MPLPLPWVVAFYLCPPGLRPVLDLRMSSWELPDPDVADLWRGALLSDDVDAGPCGALYRLASYVGCTMFVNARRSWQRPSTLVVRRFVVSWEVSSSVRADCAAQCYAVASVLASGAVMVFVSVVFVSLRMLAVMSESMELTELI